MTSRSLVGNLQKYRKDLKKYREYLLTNLIMIGETPAPTFSEQRRSELLLDRMVDSDISLTDCTVDDAGNVLGFLPGKDAKRNILITAHQDTSFAETEDHTVVVRPHFVSGLGLADNSLGLAVLVSLARLLSGLGITLSSNVILLATSKSLGEGNLAGIQHYLDSCSRLPDAGICLEGFPLGRLSCLSIGMLRCQVRYTVPEFYDWTRFGASGAIVSINEIINNILEIPQPQRPRTSIVMNHLESSTAYNVIPGEALLQLEIRSDSVEIVESIQRTIEDICAEAAAKSGAKVSLEEIARRYPGNLSVSHPLVVAARAIMKELEIEPHIIPSTSELTAFMMRNIPAITIGLSLAEHYNTRNEQLMIDPMFDGLAQLLALLQAADVLEDRSD